MDILRESGGGRYVPELMVDSSREYKAGVDYSTIESFVESSQERPATGIVTGTYQRTGNNVTFKITVTNNTGETLSAGNKAAVHAIIYENESANNIHKSSWVGRYSARASISYLPDGATESFIISGDASNVVNWNNAKFLVLADYKPSVGKDKGVYDQIQASVPVVGDVSAPEAFSISPETLTFNITDREDPLPTGEFTVNQIPGKTWTAVSDTDWLIIEPESGAHGDKITVSLDKSTMVQGKNEGLVIVSEVGGTRQRAGLVVVNLTVLPAPRFTVLPVSLTYTIKHDDPPGTPIAGVRIGGDADQTWEAEASHDWIVLDNPTGSVPGTLRATFDRTKLVEGLNEGTITVRDGGGYHERTVTVKVTYIGNGEDPEPPVLDKEIFFPLITNP